MLFILSLSVQWLMSNILKVKLNLGSLGKTALNIIFDISLKFIKLYSLNEGIFQLLKYQFIFNMKMSVA